VLKIEPLASADPETIVAAVGPNVQRFLVDPMPEIFPSHRPAHRPSTA
jgi:hypothetical protein